MARAIRSMTGKFCRVMARAKANFAQAILSEEEAYCGLTTRK